MADFHFPNINPFQVPQKVGSDGIESNYLFNNYYMDYTPAKWRQAVDRAIQYSDLTLLDTIYSYSLQSSPFLESQINKRLIPLYKRNFAFEVNGKIDKKLTEEHITNSWWFRKFMRYIALSKFYGVKLFQVDPEKRELLDFPLRNIDIFNKALRLGTYQYYSIINAKDYDNLFYFQPDTDQDFKLGLLQPISRAMIGIVQMFVNWELLGKRYSFPLTTIGYNANNAENKNMAKLVAQNLDMMTIPLIPFRSEYGNAGRSIYAIEVNPVQTQTQSDAFRVMKEYVIEYRSEIMQLVTGGTLLGATEKNTNSENLAEIHMQMYRDILDTDTRENLEQFNRPEVTQKLAKLLKTPRLADAKLVEIPDKTVTSKLFVEVGDMMARQGLQYSEKSFEKVGLETSDIKIKEQKESLTSKLFGKKPKKEEVEE